MGAFRNKGDSEKRYARRERNKVVVSHYSGITQGEARSSKTALTDRRLNLNTKEKLLNPFLNIQVLWNPDVNLCQKQKRCMWQAFQCASLQSKVFCHIVLSFLLL